MRLLLSGLHLLLLLPGQLLLLLLVLLLQLLGLLPVLLFNLLLPRRISLLFRQLLVLLLLLLLEFLPFLRLLRAELLLLLLIFLVLFRVSCVGSGRARNGRKFVGMNSRARASGVCLRAFGLSVGLRLRSGSIGWRGVGPSRLFGRHYLAGLKCSRCGSGRNGRLAMVRRNTQLRIGAGSLHLLGLSRHGRNVFFARRGLFLRCRPCCYPTVAAVVADAVHRRVVDHGGVVNVVNVSDVYVIHRAVIVEMVVFPTPALVTVAEVTEAIVNSAIETDHWSPEAFMEDKPFASPTPPAGSPEKADLRGQDPGSRHPVVVAKVGIIRPVARGPDVTVGWARRLHIHRKRGRTERNYHAELRKGCGTQR